MKVHSLQPTDPLYPAALTVSSGGVAPVLRPVTLLTVGDQRLLAERKTAVFCSRSCPGEIILRVYDLARRLRDSDLTFIGGFHTPVERDFMHHLLGGRCRIIICPARGLEGMRLPAAWRAALEADRLLLLSPFNAGSHRRQSARLAERRNEMVAALANQILLLHASPGGATERLVNEAARAGKRLLTTALDDEMFFQQLMVTPPPARRCEDEPDNW